MLQASSSLMKKIFDDISSKILDSDYVIILPDYTDAEIDCVLRNIYGFETTNPGPDPFTVDFNEEDRIRQREKIARKPKVEQEEKETTADEDYQFSNYVEPVTYDVKPAAKSRKRGRNNKYFTPVVRTVVQNQAFAGELGTDT